MRRRVVILLIALVLISDAAILALAAWNRAGEPECVLALTERELALPAFKDEDSTGLTLNLVAADLPWFAVKRVAGRRGVELKDPEYGWLDDAKLAALGFRTDWRAADAAAMERYAMHVVRPAFVALEMDGDGSAEQLAARRAEVEQARAALTTTAADPAKVADLETLLALEQTMRSRLVAVDAGPDRLALRARFADRGRYCIVPGLIRLVAERPATGLPRLRGRVQLLVDEIDVPLRLRSRLAPFLPSETAEEAWEKVRREQARPPWPAPAPPRYTVTLAFGRRLEPWIVDVAPLATESP